jgi:hypothetical protein
MRFARWPRGPLSGVAPVPAIQSHTEKSRLHEVPENDQAERLVEPEQTLCLSKREPKPGHFQVLGTHTLNDSTTPACDCVT